MDRRGRTAAVARGRAIVLAAAALLTGCTMCPDPYDYSGPVPNGSAPQNDFRARSRGILPLGATPRPWPPIVKHEAAKGNAVVQVADQRPAAGTPRRTEPTLAEADGDVGGDPSGAVEVEPTSVLVSAEDDEPATPEPPAAPREVVDPPPMLEISAPLAETEPAVEAASLTVEAPTETDATSQAVEVPTPAVEVPTLAETPGWRPRQAR